MIYKTVLDHIKGFMFLAIVFIVAFGLMIYECSGIIFEWIVDLIPGLNRQTQIINSPRLSFLIIKVWLTNKTDESIKLGQVAFNIRIGDWMGDIIYRGETYIGQTLKPKQSVLTEVYPDKLYFEGIDTNNLYFETSQLE